MLESTMKRFEVEHFLLSHIYRQGFLAFLYEHYWQMVEKM